MPLRWPLRHRPPWPPTELPYWPDTDLVPVSGFAFSPMAVVVRADSPYRSLKDLLDAAHARPGTVSYGTGGNGTTPHFVTMSLAREAGVRMLHVPFKGAGEATLGLLSGTVDVQIASPPGVMSSVRLGQARLLAVSGSQRLAAFADVPTLAESGLPNAGLVNFTGLWAPKGTPDAIRR